MYTISKISRRTACLFGLAVLLVLLYASIFSSGLKLANNVLQPLWRQNDKKSGLGLFLDKGLSENGSLPLREISEQDNAGDSSKFIFINSYMRSGSTFLGRVVGYRSDVFYYYEPLHKVWSWRYTKGSKLCDLKRPSCEYS